MKKIHYNTEIQKEDILLEAKRNGWILKEDATTIHGKYLIFDENVEGKIQELALEQAQNSMEMLNALNIINTNNEISQATMMMELLNIIATLQGGE